MRPDCLLYAGLMGHRYQTIEPDPETPGQYRLAGESDDLQQAKGCLKAGQQLWTKTDGQWSEIT